MLDIDYKEALEEKRDFINLFPLTKTFTTSKGKTITRNLYSFEVDFPALSTKRIIFSHGKSNYKIWFLNAKKKLCVIDDAVIYNNDIYLTVTIDVKNHKAKTRMSLDRFLSLVEKGDFKITFKKFTDTYLKPVTESNYYKKTIGYLNNKIKSSKRML